MLLFRLISILYFLSKFEIKVWFFILFLWEYISFWNQLQNRVYNFSISEDYFDMQKHEEYNVYIIYIIMIQFVYAHT